MNYIMDRWKCVKCRFKVWRPRINDEDVRQGKIYFLHADGKRKNTIDDNIGLCDNEEMFRTGETHVGWIDDVLDPKDVKEPK